MGKYEREAIKKRASEIIQAYLVEEPEEDVAVIAMFFRKGKEKQEKILRYKKSEKSQPFLINQVLKPISAEELSELDIPAWYESILDDPCDYCTERNCEDIKTCKKSPHKQ